MCMCECVCACVCLSVGECMCVCVCECCVCVCICVCLSVGVFLYLSWCADNGIFMSSLFLEMLTPFVQRRLHMLHIGVECIALLKPYANDLICLHGCSSVL